LNQENYDKIIEVVTKIIFHLKHIIYFLSQFIGLFYIKCNFSSDMRNINCNEICWIPKPTRKNWMSWTIVVGGIILVNALYRNL